MNYLGIDMDDIVTNFFEENIGLLNDFKKINSLIRNISGINNFFNRQEDASELLEQLSINKNIFLKPERREYGDFQTNIKLAEKVVKYISTRNSDFEFVLEPTCGQGNFILAVLDNFPTLKKVVGIEIYQPYVKETMFKILTFFLENKRQVIPDIDIINGNTFNYNFQKLSKETNQLKSLIIGNPPWVTNAELGALNSENLPKKSNFKKFSGFDAITGKGNFDIGEYISILMLEHFDKHDGYFGFLLKNSVIKNIVYEQKRNRFRISELGKLSIDSKKEFDASVNASLFLTKLNKEPEFECREIDFYSQKTQTDFGWSGRNFVFSLKNYSKSSFIDGESPFSWRSGIKHDCSKIMELELKGDIYTNLLGEQFQLENNLVYGLLKSSDLKNLRTKNFRKLTIVTQKRIGEDTSYIKDNYPLTYQYLVGHQNYFGKRKSSIYLDKPKFSIFGVGRYSFAKYKVAISGLYKTTHFTLVEPFNDKALMLDDTCYFIGFEDLKMAEMAHLILNSEIVQTFLDSIIFSDAKRPINKDILMRISLCNAVERVNFNTIKENLPELSGEEWTRFKKLINQKANKQMLLFG
ncbi:MAG: hypothetical protein ACRDE2_01020 [Chitinophagaceae bacterium]